MDKSVSYKYSAPGILTDEQEESFQALEYEKMFGSGDTEYNFTLLNIKQLQY